MRAFDNPICFHAFHLDARFAELLFDDFVMALYTLRHADAARKVLVATGTA